MKRNLAFSVLPGLVLWVFSGCHFKRVYEENTAIPDYVWLAENIPEFEVEIEDTAAVYDIYVNIRHTFYYNYSNLWVVMHTKFPTGEKLEKRVELPLAEKDGKWHGDCLGDICDARVPIQQNAYFETPGTYVFRIEQNMRQNPLGHVMAVGLRIERAGERPKP